MRAAQEAAKEDFQQAFGDGYTENFSAPGYQDFSWKLPLLLKEHAAGSVAVDIGCGSGKLTIELLTPLFSKVYALDVIRRVIPEHPKIEYIEVPSRDYSVHGVSADSVDFVFSLGCFCHLTNSANQQYLHNIHRVLKPGGRALLIYANCPNNPAIPADRVEHSRQHCRESATANAWCYMDRETLDQLICATKFRTWINVFPEGRDLVALLCKE